MVAGGLAADDVSPVVDVATVVEEECPAETSVKGKAGVNYYC